MVKRSERRLIPSAHTGEDDRPDPVIQVGRQAPCPQLVEVIGKPNGVFYSNLQADCPY